MQNMRFYFTIKLSSKSETQSRHNKAQNTTKSGSVPFALWKTYCISTFTLAIASQKHVEHFTIRRERPRETRQCHQQQEEEGLGCYKKTPRFLNNLYSSCSNSDKEGAVSPSISARSAKASALYFIARSVLFSMELKRDVAFVRASRLSS